MSKRNKILWGVAGAAGTSIVAWRTLFPWIGYDIQSIRHGIKALRMMNEWTENRHYLIDMFEESVAKYPNKPFIIFEDQIYTYEYMNQQANRVANIAKKWNLKVTDTVAIMIYNEPAFIWTFMGLQKLGIGVAFINYHIRHKPLLHTLHVSEAKVLIVGAGQEMLHSVEEVRDGLGQLPIYVQGTPSSQLPQGYTSWDDLMMLSHPVPICRQVRSEVQLSTPCCYIYTSGTTGLPKPSIINQAKCIGYSVFFQLIDLTTDDIMYTTTPLYHSAASALGLFSTIAIGSTMVLRTKFSSHHFWEEVCRHKVTVIQYIGELCRYLLAVPKSSFDTGHCVRVAVGNGLRPDIWEGFQKRFQIPWIAEFFGATEGSGALVNLTNKPGAIGRISPFLSLIDKTPKILVKYDPDTEQPLRDKSGRCIKVKIGEPGLCLAASEPSYVTDGQFYKGGKEMNEKKIVRNAFREGDQFYNYGDLLYQDKDYYVYFKDRVGDTFRWKGENVSTSEVANALTMLDFVEDANVYGVEVPGTDGRGGMAAILLVKNQDVTEDILRKIYRQLEEELPNYARPLFLRFQKEMHLTTTYKLRKVELVKEGFDPSRTSDPIFCQNPSEKTYSPVTSSNYANVLVQAKSKL